MTFRLITIAGAAALALVLPRAMHAATLRLTSPTTSIAPGAAATVQVRVTSTDQALNAVAAAIAYPKDLVEITRVTQAGSIVQFWAQQPTRGRDTISGEGVVFAPGFVGRDGLVFAVTFRAKAPGRAAFSIHSASVLANDGLGTDILTGTSGITLTITEPAPPKSAPPAAPPPPSTPDPIPEPAPAPQPDVSDAPIIALASPTHPNADTWYASRSVALRFILPPETAELRVGIGPQPTIAPTLVLDPGVREFVRELTDGTWYVALRARIGNTWHDTEPFRIRIDNSSPEQLDIVELPRHNPEDPRARFLIAAADRTSGITRIAAQIDTMPPARWIDTGTRIFQTKPLSPGDHRLTIVAMDGAGNTSSTVREFTIAPFPYPATDAFRPALSSAQRIRMTVRTFPSMIWHAITSLFR